MQTDVLRNRSVLPAVLISPYLHRYVNEALCVSRKARLQRGNLLLKQGKLDEAESDFKKVVSSAIWSFQRLTRRCQSGSVVKLRDLLLLLFFSHLTDYIRIILVCFHSVVFLEHIKLTFIL